jgi:cytochrome P450
MLISLAFTAPSLWAAALLPFVLTTVYVWYKVLSRFWMYIVIYNDVAGPDNPSWIFGNYLNFYQKDVCLWMGQWMKEYGGAFRYWAFLGERRLVLSDPVALNYVLHTNWTNYTKNPAFARFIDDIIGTGLLIAEGEQYKRQRFAMQKGFTAKTVRGYHPIFVRHARNFRRLFLHRLERYDEAGLPLEQQKPVLTDVAHPSKRFALDAVSDAGFGESFAALSENPETFGNVIRSSKDGGKEEEQDQGCQFGLAAAYDLLSRNAAVCLGKTFYVLFDVATWFVPALHRIPMGMISEPNMRRAKRIAKEEANKVFRREYDRALKKVREEEAIRVGKMGASESMDWGDDKLSKKHMDGEDAHGSIIGLLIRALMQNEGTIQIKDRATEKRGLMHEKEVRDQINTLMLAGHDTTGTTLAWFFYVMAKYPDKQLKLRRAIVAKRLELGLAPVSRSAAEEELAALHSGRHSLYGLGDASDLDPGRDLSFDEMDSIEYLDWTLQETLRLYGPVHTSSRTPLRDDVIPVDPKISPNAPAGGIRVKAGASVDVPLEALNHSPLWWGDDADKFVPERWGNKDIPGVGTFPNRWGGAAFSLGNRSCIGLKFVMAELRAIVSVLMPSLAFEDSGHRIARNRWIVSCPVDVTVGCEQCPVLLRRPREEEMNV